ncbi:MAG: PIN domain-containing protein [Deltaproteobacteria bacterium]|nr:PIN domain-containing protein [Deltaproteobacteria bacterium]
MNVLLVDTSVWISYFNGKSYPQLDLALKEGRVYLSPVVAAELLSAKLKPGDRAALEAFLRELPLCETPFGHWVLVGALRSSCSSKGIHISTPDAHIAQSSLDLDGYLFSEDRIFSKLSGVTALKLVSD